MKEFNLENAIVNWVKVLHKQQGLEPGFIEELESNLRDRIEDYLEEGLSEQEAFQLAGEKTMPTPECLADEYHKARTAGNKTPPWRRKPSLLSKLPMHFKIGIRNLNKRRIYSMLNVSGLAISICASFLIWLYVQEQRSYDQHFEDAERIYRVIFDVDYEDVKAAQADVGQPVGPTLKADYPEVTEVARLRRIGATNTLASPDNSIESTDFFVADDQFFKVFSVELSSGNPETVLSQPNTVVISEELAMKFFGRTDVVGNTLKYSGLRPPMDVMITGVMTNLDKHTHLPFQALISYGTYFLESDLSNWLRKSYTYVMLNEQNNIESLRAKIPDFNRKYLDQVFEKINARGNLLFQPLTSIYLDDDYLGEPYPHGNRGNLKILTAVMVFLLIMACINYVNLATARSVDRAVEVGLRKTLGSSRLSLFSQFMSEAVLLALFSGILAIIISLPLLPYYREITGSGLDVQGFLVLENIGVILLVSISIGLLSGFYPSVYLTSFTPKTILKGRFSSSKKGAALRKILIISQYVLSSILITWILTVTAQIKYMKNKEVGFDKEGLIELTIPDDQTAMKNIDVFIRRVNALPYVRAAAKTKEDLSTYYPSGAQRMEGPDGLPVNTNMSAISVGYDFISAIGASIVKGRGFDRTVPDERAVMINEAAAKEYGWEGRELEVKYLGLDREGKVTGKWKVAGVVSDFKFGESYVEKGPMIIYLDNRTIPESNLLIGLDSEHLETTLLEIIPIWEELFDIFPFEIQLIKEKLDAIYWREQTFLNLLTTVCIIVVFITSLGIIGLISFTTEIRKKELALRKVVGASLKTIMGLLSRQFVILLIVASLIAIPLGYYITDQWLMNFQLHINFSIWPFLLTLGCCLIFTVLALSYHAFQAAKANPVEALRSE
ncbi:MAG: FtsX-like permease family protein [Roseivirga sp.]|nr:FtsX-like permease family protein [Roseivirga sp.]